MTPNLRLRPSARTGHDLFRPCGDERDIVHALLRSDRIVTLTSLRRSQARKIGNDRFFQALSSLIEHGKIRVEKVREGDGRSTQIVHVLR